MGERGWGKAARYVLSHAFMIQDTTSIGEFDGRDEDYLLMKEFVANAVYGITCDRLYEAGIVLLCADGI